MKLIEIKKQIEFFERLNLCFHKTTTGDIELDLAVGINILNEPIPLDIDDRTMNMYLTEINNSIKVIGKKYSRGIKVELIKECKKLEKELEEDIN